MKRSDKPTDYIFILADTASEWDNCDFAIIKVTGEWRNAMLRRLDALEKFDTDDEFCGVRYWDSSADFYQNPEEEESGLPKDILKEDEVWCFITPDNNELNSFKVPESSLSAPMLTIYDTGTAIFSASGKHTGEEFWTEGFYVLQLISTEPDTIINH